MCSIDDDDGKQTFEEKIALSYPFCRQCNTVRPMVVLRGKDAYCKDCFILTCTHKFRSTLGKSKLMKPIDHVLICFTGSASSVALLHLVSAGINETSHKKLLFKISLCYVDESVVDKSLTNISTDVINLIKSNFGLECHVVRPEDISNMYSKTKSVTAKQDLLVKFRMTAVSSLAKELNCNKIFTAESANDLAIDMLSNVCLGRGNQLTLDIGFCDARYKDILILRPMREFTNKEIQYYCHLHNLSTIYVPSITTKSTPNVSIQKLTEEFVTSLQEEFPSTVYTVYKTADKLGTQNYDDEHVCILCHGGRVAHVADSSAVQATWFSKQVSNLGPKNFHLVNTEDTTIRSCGECSCSSNSNSSVTMKDLEKYMCYGCLLIFKDLDSLEDVPDHLVKLIQEKSMFNNMKEQIAEYLLE